MSRLGFVLGTVCACSLLAREAPSHTTAAGRVPHNIVVDQRLDAVVVRMMRYSPTFREQCAHLGTIARLRVQVIVHAGLPRTCRADAVIQKYQFGRIQALVRLPSDVNADELIAHELEHVREYVDGTNYKLLAASWGTGVWITSTGQFETARAVAIGRRVTNEVKGRLSVH